MTEFGELMVWPLIWISIGLVMGFIGHEIASVSYFRQAGDANPVTRTPVCVGGKFYYVVPEQEYVRSSLHLLRHPQQRVDPATYT